MVTCLLIIWGEVDYAQKGSGSVGTLEGAVYWEAYRRYLVADVKLSFLHTLYAIYIYIYVKKDIREAKRLQDSYHHHQFHQAPPIPPPQVVPT